MAKQPTPEERIREHADQAIEGLLDDPLLALLDIQETIDLATDEVVGFILETLGPGAKPGWVNRESCERTVRERLEAAQAAR